MTSPRHQWETPSILRRKPETYGNNSPSERIDADVCGQYHPAIPSIWRRTSYGCFYRWAERIDDGFFGESAVSSVGPMRHWK